jgi:hypothetical protein
MSLLSPRSMAIVLIMSGQHEDASGRCEEVACGGGERLPPRSMAIVLITDEAAPADNDKVGRLGQICTRAGEPIHGPC